MSKWLVVGAVAMFLLFAVFIGAGILGGSLFAGADGGPPPASSGTGSESATETPPPSASSTDSTSSRSTTDGQAGSGRPTSDPTTDRTATNNQGTASTASDGFGTLTDRSPTATPPPPGADSATPQVSEAEATANSAGDASDDTTGASANYTDDDFSAALQKEGIPVETLFATEDPASGDGSMMTVLEYTTQASKGGARDEASVVAQVYASAVAKGYGSQALSVTVYTANDDPVATYRIERAWAIAYENGDISGEEYGRRIGDTYRSY